MHGWAPGLAKMPSTEVGQQVDFTCFLNAKNQPQAAKFCMPLAVPLTVPGH